MRPTSFGAAALLLGTLAAEAQAPHAAHSAPPAEPPAHLGKLDALPGPLAAGLVVISVSTENVRLMPVYGTAALGLTPRVGHLHVKLGAAPWHWVHAGPEEIVLQGLPPGRHSISVTLADPAHRPVDSRTLDIEVPAVTPR